MHLRYILALGGLLIFTGCKNKNQLLGSWKFDPEFTASQIKIIAEEDGEALGGYNEDQLVAMVSDKFEGVVYTFTPDEVLLIRGNGSGEGEVYTVVDKPDLNTWRIKFSDGELATWEYEDGRLMTSSQGAAEFKVYFSRSGG